ncbi:MAG: DUF3891 family protein [Vicinamibacterales bacterium]
MIIRREGDRLLLVRQPDHAALARQMLEPWQGPLATSPRRASILHAIGAHDDGWLEVDQAPVVDEARGDLLDFVAVPLAVRHAVWPRAVGGLAEDPWAAALVAQHAITVFERFRGDPDWVAFFEDLERRRAAQVAAADGHQDVLEADYVYLRTADLLSLAFCHAWPEPQAYGPYTIQLEGERLWISPDPLAGREVLLSVTARVLPARPYTAQEARDAFIRAPRVTLAGVLAGR